MKMKLEELILDVMRRHAPMTTWEIFEEVERRADRLSWWSRLWLRRPPGATVWAALFTMRREGIVDCTMEPSPYGTNLQRARWRFSGDGKRRRDDLGRRLGKGLVLA